jgi:hypothetical protein
MAKRYILTGSAAIRLRCQVGSNTMIYRVAADAVLVFHFLFIVWAVGGGLLLLAGWHRALWLHLPAALWAVMIEFGGWICPLTPLEWQLRERAGEAGFSGGFVERYILAWIYPEGLTREIQIAIGAGVLILNAAIYGYWLMRLRSSSRQDSSGTPPGH